MEVATFQKLIQNIEDFVFIEDKIVTCLWLCQALQVHVNTAKQLLYAFLEEDGVRNKVSVTYILGGELKNGQGVQLKLVEENGRLTTKDQFSKLTTDHIYSIQKSTSEINPTNIYNSYPHFNINSEDRQFCAIKPSKEVEKREIKQTIVEVRKEISKPQPKETKCADKNERNKSDSANDAQEPPTKLKKTSPEKANKNKMTKGGIADMFNRQNEKNKSDPLPNKTDKKVGKAKPGGISGFFQKQPAKKQDSVPEPMEVDTETHPIKETNNKVERKEKQTEVAKNNENNKLTGQEDSQKSPIKEKKIKGKENRKKRKKKDEKEDDSRKKRKRIAKVFSSESESSDNERSDIEMEPDPPPVSAPILKEVEDEEEDIIPPTPGRKRVRKQIDKTYTDEDGYILTKKEFVYESCTDDEEKEEIKEEHKKTPVKEEPIKSDTKAIKKEDNKKASTKRSPSKKKSPTNDKSNNKQASIMSFFKKK